MTAGNGVPEGFELLPTSAFVEHLGGLYHRPDGPGHVFGMRVGPEHANVRGRAHGGFLATAVDVAASRGARAAMADGSGVSTMTMTLDYLAPVDVGDWIELVTSVDRIGGRTVFTTCRVTAGDRLVARGSVILARVRPRE
ncbi:PaaI family thioesterase [Pseudonocardia sp. RS11V-5]|uniref:PaaI family thioesterase n=1 Tax=Pseudonocardia terrae TaxID=2905831 RepID=UPI001E4D2787|nr:PaaI family thioesterase [Pseudonocardia terrae]MCE3555603.1 PaaI family thioesterase [Pseudonocardia terrae]